jgi:hypothetical protein
VGRKPVQARPPAGVSKRAPSSMSQDLECGKVGQFAKSRQHHPIGCSLVRASWLCSMMELIVSHLHQTRPTKFVVKNVNECPHDQTSLLSHCWTVSSACSGHFRGAGKMVSLRWGCVSFPTGGETASRKRQQPSQADLQARRVQNVAQPTPLTSVIWAPESFAELLTSH